MTALTTLGVWELCRGQAAPLRVMRIVDDTGRLWRAPEVKFSAGEIDLDAFGYNIENRHLVAALEQRARAMPGLRLIEGEVAAVEPHESAVAVTLKSDETLTAALVVGADGRHSLCREAAGIGVDAHKYRQVALTVSLRHSRPHRDTSTEFHTADGPFTLVPLPGNRSSLVWVLHPADAEHIAALDDAELSAEIERASHSILGKIEVEPGRGLFPLSVASARRFAGKRIALVGEAAHVIPPIGAQGLNLGLRDAAAIGELAVEAHRAGRDIGGVNVLTHYDSHAPLRHRRPHARHRSGQSLAAVGFSARSRRAGLRSLSHRPHRPVAPRADARRRRAASAQPRLMRGERFRPTITGSFPRKRENRRLLKGPKEFRNLRRDQPRTKPQHVAPKQNPGTMSRGFLLAGVQPAGYQPVIHSWT